MDIEKLLTLFTHKNQILRKKAMLLLSIFLLKNQKNLFYISENFNNPPISGKVILNSPLNFAVSNPNPGEANSIDKDKFRELMLV